jgi:hypothetical protein
MQVSAVVLTNWIVTLTATAAVGQVSWNRDIGGAVEFIGTGETVVDRGAPLNVPMVYYASDDTGTVVADPVTVASDHPVLSSTMYGAAMQVTVIAQARDWDGNSVWHPVIDRRDGLVSIFEAGYPYGPLVLDAADSATRLQILGLLAKGDPLLLRSTCPGAVDDMTILPTRWRDPIKEDSDPAGPRRIEVTYQAVTDSPPAWTPAPDWTYEAVLQAHADYQELIDVYSTYDMLLAGIPA